MPCAANITVTNCLRLNAALRNYPRRSGTLSGRSFQNRCLMSFMRGLNHSKAAHYTLTQRKYLERYLLDGRLEISNNRAERSIKPFVIDRNYVPSIFMCHRETKHIEMHRFPWKGQLINESSQ